MRGTSAFSFTRHVRSLSCPTSIFPTREQSLPKICSGPKSDADAGQVCERLEDRGRGIQLPAGRDPRKYPRPALGRHVAFPGHPGRGQGRGQHNDCQTEDHSYSWQGLLPGESDVFLRVNNARVALQANFPAVRTLTMDP